MNTTFNLSQKLDAVQLPKAAKRLWTFMRNLDQEDRLQIVALGLLRAASKYDEERGIQFSTYAHHWLRNAAQRHGPVCSRIVQIPHYHWRTRRLALEALRKLGARGDPESVMLAINALANDAPKLLDDWLQIERTAVILSLDDAKSPAFQDSRMLPSPSGSMFTWQERLEANQVISNALAHMDPRERAVIEMRFGLHGPSYTLQEIAACFNITRERVRQLEALTLEKLRRRLSRSFEAEPAADMSPCEATQSPASLQRQSDSIDGSLL